MNTFGELLKALKIKEVGDPIDTKLLAEAGKYLGILPPHAKGFQGRSPGLRNQVIDTLDCNFPGWRGFIATEQERRAQKRLKACPRKPVNNAGLDVWYLLQCNGIFKICSEFQLQEWEVEKTYEMDLWRVCATGTYGQMLLLWEWKTQKRHAEGDKHGAIARIVGATQSVA